MVLQPPEWPLSLLFPTNVKNVTHFLKCHHPVHPQLHQLQTLQLCMFWQRLMSVPKTPNFHWEPTSQNGGENFVPMIVQYLAWQLNPWAVPPLQLIPIMQIIWYILFDSIPQTITYNYQCNLPYSKCSTITLDSLISKYYIQAMQHVADSWHSPMGSSAIKFLLLFPNGSRAISNQ